MTKKSMTTHLLVPVLSTALRIGLGLFVLVFGAAVFALLLFMVTHATLRPDSFLLIFSALLVAIGIFCSIVGFRLLRNTTNRKGHLLPAWFYFGLGCTLTASFFAVLWAMYKKGDFSDFVMAVQSFGFIITLCLLAYRATKKPAPGYYEV